MQFADERVRRLLKRFEEVPTLLPGRSEHGAQGDEILGSLC